MATVTFEFESEADEKEMVKAVLDAPLVVTLPEYFDIYIDATDAHRIEVIDFLNMHEVSHQSCKAYVRVVDEPDRLYLVLVGLVARFPFFIFI